MGLDIERGFKAGLGFILLTIGVGLVFNAGSERRILYKECLHKYQGEISAAARDCADVSYVAYHKNLVAPPEIPGLVLTGIGSFLAFGYDKKKE